MNPPPEKPRANSFEWEAERRFPLIFAGLLFISFLAHAAAFFIFQVRYPQRVTIPPLAPQVTVLSPDLPEHQQLLAWIAAEDPALGASATRATLPGVQQVPYQPSYAAVRTLPRSAPGRIDPVPLPAGLNGIALLEASVEDAIPQEKAPFRLTTSLTVSEALAARAMRGSFTVRAPGSSPLDSAEFLIGVSSSGEVRYSFLQRSSGNNDVDDAASAELSKLSFSPAPSPITWGFVTVSWGDDTYLPQTQAPRTPEVAK
ncbi:hypothetical protein ACXR0O_22090 [Verrucomicrobiota bacterium sgz303538]